MTFKLLKPLALSLSLFTGIVHASNDELKDFRGKLNSDWTIVKNDRLHNIKTYIKQEDGKQFRSFKVEAMLDGSLERYVRLVTNFDDLKRWSWQVKESKLLKKVSATEYYVYVVHNTPVGIPDRDVVLRMTFEPPTANKPHLTVITTSVPSYIPPKPPYIRMQAEDMVSKIMPVSKDKIQMTTEGYIDPSGNMASWAINFVQRSSPYAKTLGLNRALQQDNLFNNNEPLPFSITY